MIAQTNEKAVPGTDASDAGFRKGHKLRLEEIGLRALRWDRGETEGVDAPSDTDWAVAVPDDAGLDGATLSELAAGIAGGEFGNVHSLLVVRDGKLVVDHYFTGPDMRFSEPLGVVEFGPDTLHDLRSVTKSVVGALVGIAHGDGAIPDLDAPIASFFPEHATGREADLSGRTLRHALTMTAGLEWDELTYPYWDARNDENGLWRATDPLEYALSRHPVSPGGASYLYNGGLPTMLAAVVERATGLPLDRFARERLWCPLGVRSTEWIQHQASRMFVAASGLRLRPRDMARFGQMMLDDGTFNGVQIVPADYVRRSLSPQVSMGRGASLPSYGYQWPIGEFPMASGNGGQRIVVDRGRRVVVVITAGFYDMAEGRDVATRIIERVMSAIR